MSLPWASAPSSSCAGQVVISVDSVSAEVYSVGVGPSSVTPGVLTRSALRSQHYAADCTELDTRDNTVVKTAASPTFILSSNPPRVTLVSLSDPAGDVGVASGLSSIVVPIIPVLETGSARQPYGYLTASAFVDIPSMLTIGKEFNLVTPASGALLSFYRCIFSITKGQDLSQACRGS